MTSLDILSLVTPAALWGGNAVVGKSVSGQIGPFTLSFLRWMLATCIVLPFSGSATRAYWPSIRLQWKTHLLIAFLGVGCYNTFQYLALQTSSPVNATLVASAIPIIVLIVGALFFKAPVRGVDILGVIASMAGVVCVLAKGQLQRLAALQFVPGDLIMLLAAFTWSFYTWVLRTKRPPLPAMVLLTVQMGLGSLTILPFAVLEAVLTAPAGPIYKWDVHLAAALAYIAIGPSILAYVCWERNVQRLGSQVAAQATNLTPLFAAVFSVLFLGESIAAYHLIGAVLIFAGICITSLKPPER